MKSESPTPIRRTYRQGVRAQAAEATGARITEAFLARVMVDWFDDITLDQIARDAGVTVQTIIRRFGGKEGLIEGTAQLMGEQINARRAAPVGDIDKMIENLVADYEQTGDPVLRLLALEPRQPALKKVLTYGRSEHRRWVASMFDAHAGVLVAAARERAVDALVIVTDVYAWKLLRRDMGRSRTATVATMKGLVRALLADLRG